MWKLVLEGFLVFEEGVGSNPTLDKGLFTLYLLFFNYWLRLKDIKIKSGDKVDNKVAESKVAIVTKEILIVLILFAIATNNATSDLFNCYLEQQSVNASEQSLRRPVLNLSEQDRVNFEREIFDIIVVPDLPQPIIKYGVHPSSGIFSSKIIFEITPVR